MPTYELEIQGRQFQVEAPNPEALKAAVPRIMSAAGLGASAPAAPGGDAALVVAPAEPETWGSYLQGLGREAVQGATMDFGDELGLTDRDASKRFGEQHPIASTVAKIAGGVLPFVAGPGAALARAAVSVPRMLGITGNIARSAALGAGTGAVAGAGGAEGGLEERAMGAATGAVAGGLTGAAAPPVAAAAGRVINRVLPGRQVQGPPAPPTAGQEAVLAGERIGVDVPRAMASDSNLVQKAGGALQTLPYGSPLETATTRTAQGLGTAADTLAEGLGGGTAQNAFSAGSTARESLVDWITRGVKAESAVNYDALDAVIKPGTMVPLSRARAAANALNARDVASASQDGQRVIGLVREAIDRPEGLTWEGLKELRTRVGERLYGGIAPEQGVSARALKSVYDGLTEDIRFGVQRAGIAKRGSSGKAALAAFDNANSEHARLMGIRDQLVSIVGTEGNAPAERVFDRLLGMAGVTGRADVTRLALARDVIQRARPGAWDEVASGLVARMGRDRNDEFSPGRFLTAYGRMTERGRDLIFGANSMHRQALEDIATVARRYEATISRYGNPSGTGRAVGVMGLIGTSLASPWTAVQGAAGGYSLAWLLSRPVTADAVRRYMQANLQELTRPSPATSLLVQQAGRNLMQVAQQEGVDLEGRQ